MNIGHLGMPYARLMNIGNLGISSGLMDEYGQSQWFFNTFCMHINIQSPSNRSKKGRNCSIELTLNKSAEIAQKLLDRAHSQ